MGVERGLEIITQQDSQTRCGCECLIWRLTGRPNPPEGLPSGLLIRSPHGTMKLPWDFLSWLGSLTWVARPLIGSLSSAGGQRSTRLWISLPLKTKNLTQKDAFTFNVNYLMIQFNTFLIFYIYICRFKGCKHCF